MAAFLAPLPLVEAEAAPRFQTGSTTLPSWAPGVLEIHHIATGRGNSTLILGPDGTSLLVDAGEAHSAEKTMAPLLPNGSRRAGQWVARYVSAQLNRAGGSGLDLALMTHLHGDHVGEVAASSPQSSRGPYRLTGFADVAATVPVRGLIDRGWPDYAYPAPQKDPTALNYIAVARALAAQGTKVQMAEAGSLRQLALRRSPAQYPAFSARVLSVNGEVWTGSGEAAEPHFLPLAGLSGEAIPAENACCVSLVMQYGRFRYYAGGDLIHDTQYDRYPWHDIETPVARAAGPVTVAVANHHGYFDACGPAMVRALQPRIWVLPTWHVSHPDLSTLANLYSEDLYAGERLVFATAMTDAAILTTERFSGRLASTQGHVVVRVPAPGSEFTVHVVNARDEQGTVVASFGPFAAQGSSVSS
jgi:hypothetical protein